MQASNGAILKRQVSDDIRDKVLEVGGCSYCGDQLLPLVIDHYRPLSRGGTNDIDNLRGVCVSCNSQKRAMLFHEWRLWRQHHGFPWPPVASHPTDSRHYQDECSKCNLIFDKIKSDYSIDLRDSHESTSCIPRFMEFTGDGYRNDYVCPLYHHWKCYYSIDRGYYSDCICSYCQVLRDDNGDKTYPAMEPYNAESALFKKLMEFKENYSAGQG